MATQSEAKPQSSIQEGIEGSDIDYYDVLLIGKTGMGKSTTADKLVIANLTGADYSGEQYSEEEVEGERMTVSDLSMWLIPEGETERVKRHLKDLVMFRALEKPHQEVNEVYQKSSPPTKDFQLISNETTKIRVLDVPGFFGSNSSKPEDSKFTTAKMATTDGLRIMREVLCIQATMRMKFKRILYFIPERGPLERSHTSLQMELEVMEHFFGKSIFDCMVLITTIPPDVYQYIPRDVVPFSPDSEEKTRSNFRDVLSRVLPADKKLPEVKQLPKDKPPIVFISMNDSCEEICKNIQGAKVIFDGVRLAFDSRTCCRCAIKAKFLRETGEELACYMGEDPSRSIPYNESLCHPMIISKHWKITKIVGGIAHFITRKKYIGKWPDFKNPDDEICIHCKRSPGEQGCLKVKTKYRIKGEYLLIDHTCDPQEKVEVTFAKDQQQVTVDMEA